MMSEIAVSVIVAVYNREELLSRCIDSLVYQTLDEIEIILVDDFSTDNSWNVMEQWKARFPEKLRIMKSESKGVSYAKNTGIQAAGGKYIAFVDSDDYVDYKMFKRLYECAENNNYPEMVYSPINRVYGKEIQKIATLAKHDSIEDYLKLSYHFLVGKLFRNDLFLRFGFLPHFSIGEDVSWCFPVISHISNIAYYNMPGYYYEQSANSISREVVSSVIVEDIIRGSERIIEKVNPKYKEYALIYAFLRISSLSKARPIYWDIFNKYIREHLYLLEKIEDLNHKCPALYKAIKEAENVGEEIPQIIYLNGFKEIDREEAVLKCEKAFRDRPQVIFLDKNSCDLEKCPKVVKSAYEAGIYDFVGKYFALKYCYTQGGIFIDDDIVIDCPFNPLLADSCFFGFENNNKFTDKVFGGCPNNPCIEKILYTYEYEELYEEQYASLAQRIKTVIVGMANVKMLSGMVKKLEYGFSIYPVDMFVQTLPETGYLQLCHYNEEAINNLKRTDGEAIISTLHERHMRIEIDKQNVPSLKRDRDFLKKKYQSLEKEYNLLKGKTSGLDIRTQNVDKILVYMKEHAEKDRDWLKSMTEHLEVKIGNLEKDRAFLQKKSSNLEIKIAGLEKDREFLQKKSGSLERKVECLEKDRIFLKSKSDKLEVKSENLKEDRNVLQNKIAHLEDKVENLEKDRLFLKDKSACLENELQDFRESLIARFGRKMYRIYHK